MWDILLAEDPQLDLVDMVCIAMLLRIRWQRKLHYRKQICRADQPKIVTEANYSLALTLLLKYPSISPPHGPQTFVGDAIYLRDNFSAAGGAQIIAKYSGKSPMVNSPTSPPSTALGDGLDQKQKLLAARSRLQSPSRFLQQQGGVEALLQGAARGVFDRGERLGINQAVRDAVGEVKKNMQGLQASRANSKTRRTPDVTRWSLDEGRSVPASSRFESAMKSRNQQLAYMLDQAMADLRYASVSADADKDDYIKAIDIAVAKVGFVKVYLEDSTMPLPPNPKYVSPEDRYSPQAGLSSTSPARTPPHIATLTASSIADPRSKVFTSSEPSQPQAPISEAQSRGESPMVESLIDEELEAASKKTGVERSETRPAAPLPTRSSIAQSNFSWMLEPDATLGVGSKSSLPSSPSPFLKSGRRPNSGTGRGREKAAFLFGDDGGESQTTTGGIPIRADHEEGFSLEPMRGGEEKE
jgi:TBC1 domain family protein 5